MQKLGDRLAAQNGTIAITGASGFIGLHLLRRIDELGRPSRALIRTQPNRTVNVPASTRIIAGSLSDSSALQNLFDQTQICIHLAGATKSASMSGFYTANVIGAYNAAAHAAAAGVEHFIHISSQAARAPALSDYAASKAGGEAALAVFRDRMKITIIRPPAVIGAGDPMLKPMFELIQKGWLPAPSEPRRHKRQFAIISVHDLVEQVIASMAASEGDVELIEPCSVPATNWAQVADTFSDVLQRRIRLLSIWPGFLNTLGWVGDGLARMSGRPMPISHGKIQELLAADWTYETQVQNAMSLTDVFAACFPGDDKRESAAREE